MKIFYDCEFFEDGPDDPVRPISIGMVREDGAEFYAQSVEFSWLSVPAGNKGQGSPHVEDHWLRANVLPHLTQCPSGFDQKAHGCLRAGCCFIPECPWRNRYGMREAIIDFIGSEKPELWGYYADYDHVVLCQIFGTMMDLPGNWPMYTRDIKQYAVSLGNPQIPKTPEQEHHALADARWNKWAWEFLHDQEATRAAS